MSDCQECGMFCKDGEYHPFAACLMFKASKDRNVVLANMHALMERGREIERAIPKGNECMAALSRHTEQTQRPDGEQGIHIECSAPVVAAPYMHEDALPHMTKEAYDAWYAKSWIKDGVRVGPVMGAEWAAENTDEIIQPDFDSLARDPEQASGSAALAKIEDGHPHSCVCVLCKPVSADWIPCDGSGMPVDRATQIDAKLRGGKIVANQRADDFGWGHLLASSDIIAYRIANPVTQASTDDGTPETDAQFYPAMNGGISEENFRRWYPINACVSIYISRTIERDRNRLQRENAELTHLNSVQADNVRRERTRAETAERELTSLQSTLTIHCETHGVVQAAACKYCVSELAAAQERIRSLETDLRIEKDACQITLAEATEEMKEAQERIAILSKELEAMRFIAAEPHAIAKVHAEFGPLSLWTKKGLEDHDREKDARISGLEVAFRVNMLRLRPEMSHEEIDEIIGRAGGII